MWPRRSGAQQLVRATIAALLLAPALAAQSQTERGEVAWKAGTMFALQGQPDSAIASFRVARSIAEVVHDSSLLAAALRSAAEVHYVYMGCADSSIMLLRLANSYSVEGDRTAGQLLVRRLAAQGKLAEARQIQEKLFADVKDGVPRTISRESIGYLSGQAAIQVGAGQDASAFATLVQAREIADRLASGDALDPNRPKAYSNLNSVNYWITFEMAQIMLRGKGKGVGTPADGRALMDAIASTTDDPEDGNERRFSVFRLADRLTVNAWRCTMRGETCAVPSPRKCP